MSKKDALIQFHKENISSAADLLFIKQGVDKTTMDDIARAADYSKATLYVYFKSKDDIFYFLVLKAMRMLHEKFQSILIHTEDAGETYQAVCRQLADFCAENPLYFQSMLETIAFDEDSQKQNPVLAEIYEIGECLNKDVESIMDRGIKQGVFRDDLPTAATGFVHWAALAGIVSFADNKAEYIAHRMDMTKEQFLQFGFQMMFQSIAGRGKSE